MRLLVDVELHPDGDHGIELVLVPDRRSYASVAGRVGGHVYVAVDGRPPAAAGGSDQFLVVDVERHPHRDQRIELILVPQVCSHTSVAGGVDGDVHVTVDSRSQPE